MALGLDFLTQIVNVHWGGGVYVVGSQRFGVNPTSAVWTNNKSSEKNMSDWKKTISTTAGSGGFMPNRYPGGAVCAVIGANKVESKKGTTVFLIGGLADKDFGAAMIMRSKNGVAWSPQTLAAYGEVYLLTWNENEKAFYAGMTDLSQLLDPESDRETFDVAFRSSDGLRWSEVGRVNMTLDHTPPVEQYCSGKVIDIHGRKVPTSVFGYDENKDILIAPHPVLMTFGINYPPEENSHGIRLKITQGPNNDHPGSVIKPLPAGMNRVWVVAYAGGIWQAAGQVGASTTIRGVVATSVDDGETWKITLTDVAGSSFMNAAAGISISNGS